MMDNQINMARTYELNQLKSVIRAERDNIKIYIL